MDAAEAIPRHVDDCGSTHHDLRSGLDRMFSLIVPYTNQKRDMIKEMHVCLGVEHVALSHHSLKSLTDTPDSDILAGLGAFEAISHESPQMIGLHQTHTGNQHSLADPSPHQMSCMQGKRAGPRIELGLKQVRHCGPSLERVR